jgi:hypothetical protein
MDIVQAIREVLPALPDGTYCQCQGEISTCTYCQAKRYLQAYVPPAATVTARTASDLLNSAYQCDPAAINNLAVVRRQCSQALSDHPYVVANKDKDGKFWVSFLGLLNGMLLSTGSPELVASTNDDQGNVVGFTVAKTKDVFANEGALPIRPT